MDRPIHHLAEMTAGSWLGTELGHCYQDHAMAKKHRPITLWFGARLFILCHFPLIGSPLHRITTFPVGHVRVPHWDYTELLFLKLH